MEMAGKIKARLEAAFQPSVLNVIDESERHRGHAGWREGGQTHFRVEIRASGFAGMSRIERHRSIHAALGAELIGDIHALALAVEG